MIQIRILAVAAMLATMLSGASTAQPYPSRPVTIVVPTPAGGGVDIFARLLATGLSQALGQQFVIENKGGASGNIGTLQVARAAPDGYTLLLANSGYQVTNPALFSSLQWDPIRDFAPVAMAIRGPHILVAKKSLPVESLSDFIAYGKANPGKLNYATPGRGTINHIGSELLARMAGITMTHVPYRGSAPAVTDLLAGTMDLIVNTPPSLIAHLQAGSIKGLAIASATRHPLLRTLPTTAEAGLKGLELETWYAIYAPRDTAAPIVEKLSAEVRKIVESDTFKMQAEQNGSFAVYMSPMDLGRFTEADVKRWGAVIKDLNLTIE